jgi:hypothetical protein
MRVYGSGWFRESYRHSLAAKGITTRRSFALFKRDPSISPGHTFKSPEEKSNDAQNYLESKRLAKIYEAERLLDNYKDEDSEKARVMATYIYPYITKLSIAEIKSKLDHNLTKGDAPVKEEQKEKGSSGFMSAPEGHVSVFDFEARAAMAGKKKHMMLDSDVKLEANEGMAHMMAFLKQHNIESNIMKEVETNKLKIESDVEQRLAKSGKLDAAKVNDIVFDVMYPYINKSRRI